MCQKVDKITSTIVDQLQRQESRIQGITDAAFLGQSSSASAASRVQTQLAGMQRTILATSAQEHEKSHVQIVRGNKEVIDALRYEIGNLPAKLGQVRLEAPKSGREIRLLGFSERAVLSPLLLMRGSMHWAISHMLSHHHGLTSQERIQWLMLGFEGLLASASQEAAASFKGSTATAFDEWIYEQDTFPSNEHSSTTAFSLQSKSSSSKDLGTKRKLTFKNSPRKQYKKNSQIFTFRSCIGKLKIYLGSANPTNDTARPSDSWEVGFSFSPRPEVCSTWLTAYFKTIVKMENRLPLYTQLIALNVIPFDLDRRTLYFHGSIPEIDAAFRSGSASPYDISPDGDSWCYYVSYFY